MKRTIKCKMLPTPIMEQHLNSTLKEFADCCNDVLKIAIENKESNNIRIHHLCYKSMRSKYKLSANLVVRAMRRVSASMVRFKRKGGKPKQFKPTSIDYDARIFAYRPKDESISITTTNGRIHVPLILGGYQKQALNGKTPTAATIVKKSKTWFAHIVIDELPETNDGTNILGVDLGINNIASCSTGKLIDGKTRKKFKESRNKIRASIQSKGTKGAKKLLKRLSGYENRRIRWENHNISKQIIQESLDNNCGTIRMEKLTNIRKRTKVFNKHLNRMISGWSFGELQNFIEYKANRKGIKVEYVNPAYTSQTCNSCGTIGIRDGEEFTCNRCGILHADINAAKNIAKITSGDASKPSRINSCVNILHN